MKDGTERLGAYMRIITVPSGFPRTFFDCDILQLITIVALVPHQRG